MPVMTSFDPVKHGFAFSNSFVNTVITLPGGQQIQTYGRCGGMAFAALDYYFAGLPVPKNPTLPPDGTLLADYIYKRLMDSFSLSGPKFVTLTLAPDHPTWLSPGLTYWTKVDEASKVRANVDAKTPVVLGLIGGSSLATIGANCHQVVAIGYDPDPNAMPIYIYDNNYPGLTVTLATDPTNPHYNASTGEVWRGFFVEWYGPTIPDYLIDGTLLQENSDPKVYVIYGGAKFWIPSPNSFDALGFSWNNIRQVGIGSMDYIADIPGDGTLLKELSSSQVYVMVNGQRCWITSPADFDAHGFNWDRVRTVPDGSLANIPDNGALPPIPAPPPPPPNKWSSAASGMLTTNDPVDRIYFTIVHNAAPIDQVQFSIELVNAVTWKKIINMPDGQGNSWDIVVDGPGSNAGNGLWANQVGNGQQLTFSKAKGPFAIMFPVLSLGDLDQLVGGDRVTFQWARD